MAPHPPHLVRRQEFLVFGAPLLGEAEIAEVVASMRTGWVGTGPKVSRFERMLEEYLGVAHVRCVSSGTAALTLGMEVLGIGPGDEVIVPAMTFIASANAVEHVGATPVLVESDPRTGLLDLDAVEGAITERTRALMPVHLAGRPVNLDDLRRICSGHDLMLVQDAAHAIGAEWRGERIGVHGNLTAYSFYVTKNITTVEGGALATNDPAIAEEVERLALHGLSLGAWQRFSEQEYRHYEVVKPGYKFNMTDVQAAIGLHQLPQLDAWIERRAELWARYNRLLSDLPLDLPADPEPDTRHARHLYQVQLQGGAPITRDELLVQLARARIGAGVHYRGIHLHPYYRETYGLRPDHFPVATKISERTLSLPLSPRVSDRDQDDVAAALRAALGGESPTDHA